MRDFENDLAWVVNSDFMELGKKRPDIKELVQVAVYSLKKALKYQNRLWGNTQDDTVLEDVNLKGYSGVLHYVKYVPIIDAFCDYESMKTVPVNSHYIGNRQDLQENLDWVKNYFRSYHKIEGLDKLLGITVYTLEWVIDYENLIMEKNMEGSVLMEDW